MGISRSASVVIAYVMKAYDLDLDQALEFVKRRRSCIKPNSGFLKQLETYRGILNARWVSPRGPCMHSLALPEEICFGRRGDGATRPCWWSRTSCPTLPHTHISNVRSSLIYGPIDKAGLTAIPLSPLQLASIVVRRLHLQFSCFGRCEWSYPGYSKSSWAGVVRAEGCVARRVYFISNDCSVLVI